MKELLSIAKNDQDGDSCDDQMIASRNLNFRTAVGILASNCNQSRLIGCRNYCSGIGEIFPSRESICTLGK